MNNGDFLRNEKVDIKKYLPYFLFKDPTIEAVSDSQNLEHERLRLLIRDLLLQTNVSTATWGLALWEKDLDLEIIESDSYEARRNRIWLKLQSHNISTLEYITKVINRYASDRAEVEEVNSEYKIKIIVDDGAINDWDGLLDALYTWLPAHIAYDFISQTILSGGFYFGGLISECIEYYIPYNED